MILALLRFKTAANGSLAKYNLLDQTVDAFEDASGVDAGSSTNEDRNSAGKYYSGSTSATVSGNYDSTGTTGIYTWYKWTTVTSSGSFTTNMAQDYEYLIVAGGAGGSAQGGGGGAGGYRNSVVGETTGGGGSAEAVLAVAATTISSITVGAGGAQNVNGLLIRYFLP